MSAYRGNALTVLALASLGCSAAAAPVITEVNSPGGPPDELVYAPDVSSTDLLHGLGAGAITTSGNWDGGGAPELNDGEHGDSFDNVGGAAVSEIAWPTVGASVTFTLGAGPNGTGYDLSSLQSIAAWQSAGFGNQGYTLELRPLGGSFAEVATVLYNPLGGGAGATKVTISDDTGMLATGIDAVRLTQDSVPGSVNGRVTYRELDIFGLPGAPDSTPPVISTLFPADDASGVPGGRFLTATFDADVFAGTGNITVRNLSNASQSTIAITDSSQITFAGKVLTIDPTNALAADSDYAIQIDAGAVTDLLDNPFAGIANDTTWNFATGSPDLDPPTVTAHSPADNATGVVHASDLVVNFDEDIALAAGTITVRDTVTPTDTVITLPDPRVSISGAVLTIDPATDLSASTALAVRISPGAVTDLSGNGFAGIADDTTWNFVTAGAPLRIMCLGDSITVGYTDNPSWANHPFMFGYRGGLYTRLADAGYNLRLVGGSTEPWTGISGDPTHGGTYTPEHDIRDFGQDGHRGYGGASIGGTNSNVAGFIATDDPDIILLLIGINGIGASSPAQLDTLVENIVTTAPDVHLIVAQITPLVNYNQNLYDYNVYIRDTLVPSYAGDGHKVSTVDLYSFFLVDPSDYTSAVAPNVLSNGINHPDNPRYDLMAQAWFDGIELLGLGPDTFSKWIADPAFGLDPAVQGFNDDPDADGIPNGVENFFGTHPGEFSPSLQGVVVTGGTATFTHPQNAPPATDITVAYRWSTDLQAFHASGSTDANGTSVEISSQADTPSAGTTTVTATVSGTSTERLFMDVEMQLEP